MKINITIDVQEIFDCGLEDAAEGYAADGCAPELDLNEAIKQAVIDGMLDRVSQKCMGALMNGAKEKINIALDNAINGATESINQQAQDYAKGWLAGENITVTDRYGEVKKVCNIRDVVIDAYEKAIDSHVDNNGKFTSESYRNKKLLDYVAEKNVRAVLQERIPNLGNGIDRMIKEEIEKFKTNRIAEQLRKVIKQAD